MRVRIFNRTDLSHALKDFIIDNEDITLLNFLENGLNSEVSKRFKRCVTVLCDGVEIPHNIWSKYNLKNTQNITFVIKPQDVFSIAFQYCYDNYCVGSSRLHNGNDEETENQR